MPRSPDSIVRFYGLIEQARAPQRADRSAAGTLPTRAYRYCQAVTSAAGFGWWVFPPLDMSLMWDGADIFWQYDGSADWLPLMPSAQFPGFAAEFNEAAPPALRDCSPPFLTALPEPGTLQLWTGLMARTAPGWHLHLRAPANLPLAGGFSLFEGIVATDSWFGPLFTVMRLTRTHMPVRLQADFPLLQASPIEWRTYGNDMLSRMAFARGVEALHAEDWDAYRESVVIPNEDPNRAFGRYAVAERRRRRTGCPARTEAV